METSTPDSIVEMIRKMCQKQEEHEQLIKSLLEKNAARIEGSISQLSERIESMVFPLVAQEGDASHWKPSDQLESRHQPSQSVPSSHLTAIVPAVSQQEARSTTSRRVSSPPIFDAENEFENQEAQAQRDSTVPKRRSTWNGPPTRSSSASTRRRSEVKNCAIRHQNVTSNRDLALESMNQPRPVNPCFLTIVNTMAFESFSIMAVVLNSCMLGVQVDWTVRNTNETSPQVFDVIEVVFTCCFAFELLIRMLGAGRWFFSCQNCELAWNVFDSTLVLISVLELPLFLIIGSTINLTAARLLRLMRLMRMLRTVRLFRFFKQLRVVILTVAGSLKPLLWALSLLFVLNFLSSVVILQLIDGFNVFERGSDVENVRKLYGTLWRTQYTLFTVVTNGVSWQMVAEPLIEITSGFEFFFILHISFSFFCLANIVTGIFVESTKTMSEKDEAMTFLEDASNRQKWLAQLKTIFEFTDLDNSGELTIPELEESLKDLRIQVLLKNIGVDALNMNAKGLFRCLDFNGSGTITIDEFTEGLLRFHGQARSLDLAEVRHFVTQCDRKLDECARLVKACLPAVQDKKQRPQEPAALKSRRTEPDSEWKQDDHREKLKAEWLNLLFTDQSVAAKSPEGLLPVTHEGGNKTESQDNARACDGGRRVSTAIPL